MPTADGSEVARLLARAHAARDARRFAEAFDAFTAASRSTSLSGEDTAAWSDAAWWLGLADRALELAERAHQLLVEEGSLVRAAKEAVGIGFLLLLRGDFAAGSGWLQRGRSLLERSPERPEHGYVVHLDAEEALQAGDLDRAVRLARQAQELGRRGSDVALVSLALMTEGTARLRSGAAGQGMALLDEAMLPVQAGRVAPDFAGNLYCQMIAVCWELADLRRARAWTAATERWCQDFDSAVMFSGICRMHRVQLRTVAGDWNGAAAEAEVVCTELAEMNLAVVAEGHYLLGDLLRLRGDAAGAEAAYRRAHELGRAPQPGLALLRWQQGQVDAALASLRAALDGHRGADYRRSPLLRALVDLALDAGDVQAAAGAAAELAKIARRWPSDGLLAAAAHADGAVELARGNPRAAAGRLREAVDRWTDLEAPYDRARSRLVLAEACLAMGDHDVARLELDAAEAALQELDAPADLLRLRRLRPAAALPGGLTPREAEVLAHVARGSTNRQVAEVLVISDKTVGRHLANIYLKLGVSTRTAAADWARRHGLHEPR